VVAVIDSGIARTPELANVVQAEYDEAVTPGRAPFAPRYDHGTLVASILNRAANGAVDIISFRIDDEAGCPAGAHPPCQASAQVIAQAIDHAASLGVDAINISLALTDDPSIVAAVSRASQRGITVVMAAGNNGRDYPDNVASARSGYPRVILVGATDKSGQPWTGTNRPQPGETGYVYAWEQGVSVPAETAAGVAVTATGTSFATPIETARRVLAAKPAGTALATAR